MQKHYKIDITEGDFPMLSEQQTRTVMISGRNASPPAGEKPGVAYIHNMMPSRYGYDSVGYEVEIPPIDGLSDLNSVKDIRDITAISGSPCYITWDSQGRMYAMRYFDLKWKRVPSTTNPPTEETKFNSADVTTATVNGLTYIFYKRLGCFIYHAFNNYLEPVELTGLDVSTILGLVAGNGYLVAYSLQEIAWSSTLLPTDFAPSQITGAGGGAVQEIDGYIRFAVPHSLGFFLYCTNNVVAATTTGQASSPFKFRKISDAKGCTNLDYVAYEANSAVQIAYTKAGLQTLGAQEANTIFPAVTDFLAGRRYEDFDEETLEFLTLNLTDDVRMQKKVKYVSARYLAISYGVRGKFSYILIYDNSLQRWGKLKVEHVDVFEFNGKQLEAAKESIGVLLKDGTILSVDFSVHEESKGVLMFSRVQETRGRWITLLGVTIENVSQFLETSEVEGKTFKVYDYASLDGKKDYLRQEGTPLYVGGNVRDFGFMQTGINHAILCMGQFNCVTAQLSYTTNGKL